MLAAIGIDTHKATLAACAIDELGRAIGEATFANDPAGHDAFIAWARLTAPEATIGVEGSSSFGAPLARSVQLAGLAVREVPPHLPTAMSPPVDAPTPRSWPAAGAWQGEHRYPGCRPTWACRSR